jgi:hypothetical protein
MSTNVNKRAYCVGDEVFSIKKEKKIVIIFLLIILELSWNFVIVGKNRIIFLGEIFVCNDCYLTERLFLFASITETFFS